MCCSHPAWIQRSWSKPHTLHWFLEAFFNLRNSTNSHTPFSQFNKQLSLHRALDFWRRSENNPLFTLLHSPECDLTCNYVVIALQEKTIYTLWGNLANRFEYTRCRELRGGSCLYFISSPCVSRYGAYLVWRMTSRVHLDPHYSITRVWVGRQMFALADLRDCSACFPCVPSSSSPPSY